MLITKNNGDNAFVRRVDAECRVAVWAVNHANSPLISKLGLTHDLGRAVDASGQKILHTTDPGLTLERRVAFMPQGLLPDQGWMLPTMAQAPQQIGYAVPRLISLFSAVPLHEISKTISEMTGGYDPVYVAEELGLFQRDMDNVSGPKLCRAFCDPLVLVDGLFNMKCCDADGNFAGRYVLFNGSVFEVKSYKYTDLPDGACGFFAPSKSAIYAPAGCDGTFTTNANIADFNLGKGWLCTAGGKETLDWEIIRGFGENARLVWTVFPDDPLLTRNQFAETFAIVTEARRKGIDMKVLRAEATEKIIGDSWDAKENLLDDREIKKLARKYGLEIDPIWNGLPGEFDFDDAPPVRAVPPFWTGNRVAVFFGKRSTAFMKELVIPRITPWIDCGRVLVIVDEKDRELTRQIHAAGGSKVRAFSFDVFQNKDVFLTTVPSWAKMIFIVPPCGDGEMKVITPKILDVCAQAELPVGIFSRSEDGQQQEIAADTVLYNVAKSQSTEDVFSVKNMGKKSIINYKFSPGGVEETPGTEEDMSKGE